MFVYNNQSYAVRRQTKPRTVNDAIEGFQDYVATHPSYAEALQSWRKVTFLQFSAV